MVLQREILKKAEEVWGYRSLRPLQMEAVAAGIEKRDSLVVLPTGGGKSLCYQLPPLLTERLDIVISPLISLMKDQVDGLKLVGYPAATVHSGMDGRDRYEVYGRARRGELRLLFVSPERVQTEGFRSLVLDLRIGSLAVDEAHCISHWGHDFRKDYRRLSRLREEFPEISLHAFTATATPRVQADIIAQLKLRSPKIIVGTFDRPNLTYRILPKSNVKRNVEAVIRRHVGEAVIVYCLSRKDTETLASWLNGRGIRTDAYHAGLPPETRERVQESFSREELDVVVATVAFGMGIDRSNVRCIIHTSLPRSVEQYQQETGRAGRDGLEAECVLFYSYADVIRLQTLLDHTEEPPEPEVLQAQLSLLEDMQRFCRTLECRHRSISRYFGQPFKKNNCGACDVCLAEVDSVPDSSEIAQKILSGVFRLNQSFGVNHLVDVLTGAKTARVEQLRHDQIRTFGVLTQFPKNVVKDFVYQLLDQGILVRRGNTLPTLTLTAASGDVLRGQRSVCLRSPSGWRTERSAAESRTWYGVDAELFEELRKLRKGLADRRGVPAYLVFGDETLRELARVRPTSREQMLRVKGIGQTRLRNFGRPVLELIQDYCRRSGKH